MDDLELLKAFAREGSQEAFRALVERHQDWVYSVCVRRVGDAGLAEDATQAVFVALAQRAGALVTRGGAGQLAGWLHVAARHVAANIRRQRMRHDRLQQEAAAMRADLTQEAGAWNEMESELEPALDALPAKDREALLLRFYRQLSLQEVGTSLAISEEAAKKRVHRALERLRKILARKGVRASSVGIGAMLLTHAVQPVPVAVATALVQVSAGTAVSVEVAALAKGVIHMIGAAKLKLALACAGAAFILGAAAVPFVMAQRAGQVPSKASPVAATQATDADKRTSASATVPASQESSPLDALRAFNSALENVDPAAAGALFYAGTEQEKSMLADVQEVLKAYAGVKDALVARFGEKAVTPILPKAFNMGLVSASMLKEAKVTITGATAKVTLANLPENPLPLVLDQGKWKVNMAELLKQDGVNPDPVAYHASTLQKIEATKRMQKLIESGKFSTLEAALAEMKQVIGGGGT